MKSLMVWTFRKLLLLAMRFAVKANRDELNQGQILQVKFGRRVAGIPYDALLVVANGNVVKIHDARAVEVGEDGNIAGSGNNGPTVH
jgi:hypothetical protein